MTLAEKVVLGLLAWGCIAVGLGLVLGRAIQRADCRAGDCKHPEAGDDDLDPRLVHHLVSGRGAWIA